MPKTRMQSGLTNNLRADIMKKTAAEGDRRFEIVLQLFVTIYIVTLNKKRNWAIPLLSFLRFKIIYRLAEV